MRNEGDDVVLGAPCNTRTPTSDDEYSVIIHYFNTPEHRVIMYILGVLVVRSTEYTFIELPTVVHSSGWA
jgi:hypothetical protein